MRGCFRVTCLGMMIVLGWSASAYGQRFAGQRRSVFAARPSYGPSQQFTRQFGGVGGTIGYQTRPAYEYQRDRMRGAAPGGSRAATSRLERLRERRDDTHVRARQQQALTRNQGFTGVATGFGVSQAMGQPVMGIGRKLAQNRRTTARRYPRNRGALSSAFTRDYVSGPLGMGRGLGPFTSLNNPVYRRWVQPEAVIEDRWLKDLRAEDAGGDRAPLVEVSRKDRAAHLVSQQREGYASLAWKHFESARLEDDVIEAGKSYRRALGLFELADSIGGSGLHDAGSDNRERAKVKLGILYTGVALSQYTQAINALRWLLTPHSASGQLPDSEFLLHLAPGGDLHGIVRLNDQQVNRLYAVTVARPDSDEVKALYAVALCQDLQNAVTREDALYYAARVAVGSPVQSPWTRLHGLMVDSLAERRPGDSSRDSLRLPGGDAAGSRLPWD